MSTLAEDLVLLLTDPSTGKGVVDGTSFDHAVGGALLLDLAVAGRVVPEGEGRWAKLSVDPRATGDELLDGALARLPGGPVRARRAVEKLSRRTRNAVGERLAARGVLVREDDRMLGIFPTTRWRTADPRAREALLAELADALTGRAVPNQRVAGLVSLVHAIKVEHKLVDGPRGELRARAKEIADGDWAGPAVRQAVQAVQAAVLAATMAASSSGSN